ncbi:MAG: efflux RND transporter periplasmic adaptor subunit [Spirochaetaceae bacterium]|nr:MAG: efflux RND transporter periplasmic adaptor subunit [Spirochaetaceae bacterium]
MKVLPILAIVLLVVSCSRGASDGRSAATGEWATDSAGDWMQPAVEVVEARRGRLIDTVESTGIVAGAREVLLVTETQGVIRELGFELGDAVKAGQVMLRFDDEVERYAMQQAREELETARLDSVAIERLFERGSASRLDLSRARAAVGGAGARYESARRQFEARTVRAPFDGVVASRPPEIEAGNYLGAGSPVARVVDLESLRVDLSLGEREIALVSRGDLADVRTRACPEPVTGAVVSAVAAGADAATGSYRVRVTWSNECGDRARVGMAASVRIQVENGAAGVLLPVSAILRQRDANYAYVLTDSDRVERRELRLGEQFADRALVLEGISEGERVVSSGLTRVRDGVVVRPSMVSSADVQ